MCAALGQQCTLPRGVVKNEIFNCSFLVKSSASISQLLGLGVIPARVSGTGTGTPLAPRALNTPATAALGALFTPGVLAGSLVAGADVQGIALSVAWEHMGGTHGLLRALRLHSQFCVFWFLWVPREAQAENWPCSRRENTVSH